jgi:CBS domain-containing protein
MTVAQVCQREIDTAETLESVRIAAQRMASRCVGTLLVLDARGRPVGILTDRDIALRVVADGRPASETTVAEVMTRDPKTISELAPIEDALALMRLHAVRRLPVVSPQGQLVGVVTLDDVLASVAEEMWQMGRVIRNSSPAVLAQP